MYLKKLEIMGFKSFKEKTNFTFTKGITAIVGPNGSGKSNVVDSVRWVLGEQNAKTLRGSKMEDIIFLGAKNKKPLGLASVSLFLDNSQKSINLPYEEIIISRKYYRSGESEYQINGSTCRLKDITELFMDTGIGKDGYSIIGQGDVEQLLNNSQRRTVFEEATGINKYKIRKDAAITKLLREKESLDRINDIIREIESSLPNLLDACNKASEYLKTSEKLKLVHVNLFLKEEEKLSLELNEKKSQLIIIQQQIMDFSSTQEDNLSIIKKINKKIEKNKLEEENLKKQFNENNRAINKKEHDTLIYKEQINNIKATIVRLNNQIETSKNRQKNYDKEAVGYKNEKNKIKLKIKEEKERAESFYLQIDEIANTINSLEYLENEYNNTLNRLKVLQANNNFSKAVKIILNEKEAQRLNGIVGILGSLITIPSYLQLAIEVTLGGAINHIVTETEEDAKIAISYLKKINGGRATFLPISSIKYRKYDYHLPDSPCILGKAKDLISYNHNLKNIISNIIGDVIIIDNIDNALLLSKKINYRVTTLEGEVINKTGSITGGSINQNSNKKEISALNEKLKALLFRYKTISNSEDLPSVHISKLKNKNEQLNKEYTAIKMEINGLNQNFEYNNKLQHQLEYEINNYNTDLEKWEKEIKTLNADISIKDRLIEENNKEIKNLSSLSADYNLRLGFLNNEKQALKNEVLDFERQTNDYNTHYYDIKAEEQRLTHKIDILIDKRNQLYSNIWDEYEITYNSAKVFSGLDYSIESLKAQERELKQIIKDIGHINIQAIDQYNTVKTRWEFLDTQKKDIATTIQKLNEIINILTQEMEQQYVNGIKDISLGFDKVFKEMFGGGSAQLILSSKDDILNSSVEILAQPPGKKLTNLNLMSLGEKTLIAIAILFSILHTRPSPFVLLDEIEAPLDHSNNLKFVRYLKNFRGNIQFILISHKRLTMEAAENIYGVTMSDGTSKIISITI